MEAAKKVSNKPVKYVFDTHHHGDHAYGNRVGRQAGSITLAYKGVAEEMKRYEPKRWQDTAKQRKDVAELNLANPEPPKQTFDKSPFILKDDTREVRFYFFGWAHTRGDGFVYLPKEKVLCSGDATVNGAYNYTADGNIANWPKVVEAAQKLDVAYVLPGHGGSGGKEILEGQKQFMIELHNAVGAAVKQGKKLDDIVKKNGDKLVSTSIQLPGKRKELGGERPARAGARRIRRDYTAQADWRRASLALCAVMPFANANGIRIVYDDRGEEEPALLFLPGWVLQPKRIRGSYQPDMCRPPLAHAGLARPWRFG